MDRKTQRRLLPEELPFPSTKPRPSPSTAPTWPLAPGTAAQSPHLPPYSPPAQPGRQRAAGAGHRPEGTLPRGPGLGTSHPVWLSPQMGVLGPGDQPRSPGQVWGLHPAAPRPCGKVGAREGFSLPKSHPEKSGSQQRGVRCLCSRGQMSCALPTPQSPPVRVPQGQQAWTPLGPATALTRWSPPSPQAGSGAELTPSTCCHCSSWDSLGPEGPGTRVGGLQSTGQGWGATRVRCPGLGMPGLVGMAS